MKYIRENKKMIGWGIFFQMPLIVVLWALINGEIESDALWFIIGIPVFFELSTLWLLNRAYSKIWYDPSTQELCRKGWLWGRNYRIPLSEIKEIVIMRYYYVVIEKGYTLKDALLSRKTMYFVCSKENTEFLESFWHNFIPTIEPPQVKNYKN